MTYTATATYFPLPALEPINLGGFQADNADDAISPLMDEIREFMRNEESSDWWDDITVSIHHDSVIKHYPFKHWATHFAWSF